MLLGGVAQKYRNVLDLAYKTTVAESKPAIAVIRSGYRNRNLKFLIDCISNLHPLQTFMSVSEETGKYRLVYFNGKVNTLNFC